MAYEFVAASTQYLVTSSSPVSTEPLTLACWALKDTTSNNMMIALTDSANAGTTIGLLSTGGALVNARVTDVNTETSTAGVSVTGTWFHAAGVFNSTSSRTAYANGVAGSANLNLQAPTATDRICIGVRGRGTPIAPTQYHDGLIAEVGIWDVALTAAEIASLAAGVTCDKVRPQSLRFYAPLIRDLQDVRDGLTITNTNGATVADHPRVYK
jgi:hypothetical protein